MGNFGQSGFSGVFGPTGFIGGNFSRWGVGGTFGGIFGEPRWGKRVAWLKNGYELGYLTDGPQH